jgi:hypothetical protein
VEEGAGGPLCHPLVAVEFVVAVPAERHEVLEPVVEGIAVPVMDRGDRCAAVATDTVSSSCTCSCLLPLPWVLWRAAWPGCLLFTCVTGAP